ncbi:hypothetical protein NE237_005703 [Protea cynaroides]|uniref:Uncharacterized protein n=1 Tax=Protea cynaroides TaxID=273540 RepID=A0A9Q0KL75_9MAGN|nr:hypothetical protein NE237_005703 [Protea cynaroides]
MMALQGGIKDKDLLKSIYKRPPLTYAELMNRAEKYAAMNEALLLTHPKLGEKRRSKMEVVNKSSSEFTSLTIPMSELLHNLKGTQYELSHHAPMKLDPQSETSRKYCCYHCENGHDTDKCLSLRYAIEDRIKRGHIREYMEKLQMPTTSRKVSSLSNKKTILNHDIVETGKSSLKMTQFLHL